MEVCEKLKFKLPYDLATPFVGTDAKDLICNNRDSCTSVTVLFANRKEIGRA